MNLVALLIAPAVVSMSYGDDERTALRVLIALAAAAAIAAAVYISKRRPVAIEETQAVGTSSTA
jgi:K(+)-stimulated pyrophosphate-energized sodium pump